MRAHETKRGTVAQEADKRIRKASGPKNSRKGKSTVRRKAKTRKGETARAVEQRLTHAVNHPVRLDALVILSERCASPNEIAGELDVPLGTASFHVKELAEVGAIELVKTEPRRGAIEHYYRARVLPEVSDEEWRVMPKGAKRECVSVILMPIISESLSSLGCGKMDADKDLYVFWKLMRLSEHGRSELHELHAEFQERVEALVEKDEARADDDEPVRFVAMLGFERSRGGRATGTALGKASALST
jgi:DNA-binding transcriptional ArsR family regulator